VATDTQSIPWTPALARVEGDVLASAFEAIVKGLLESEQPVHAVHAPRRAPFEPVFRLLADEAGRRTLEQHRTEIVSSADAARAVSLTDADAAVGRASVALVPNDQLERALPALERLVARLRERDGASSSGGATAGAVVVVIEDNPDLSPSSCPRRSAQSLGLPCIEPTDVGSLRDAMDEALRLALAGIGAAIVPVHVSILRALETIRARPNRILDRVDAVLAMHRERRPSRGSGEGLGLLRLARRLELNRHSSLPSPGEREPWGFVAVGPCLVAAQHVLREVGLSGRVPLMRLGLSHPLDDAAIMRMLERCEHVAVLEPRPGSVATAVVALAERSRAAGDHPAVLWWDRLPSADAGRTLPLELNDALRPSTLARKIVHLLHAVRPNLLVATKLEAPQPRSESVPVPRRGAGLGVSGAIEAARRMVVETAGSFTDEPIGEGDAPRTSLALAGSPAPPGDRPVVAEVWDRRRFGAEGAAAIRQLAMSGAPCLMVVCDVGAADEADPERFARAILPSGAVQRFRVENADLNDRDECLVRLRRAAEHDGLSLVVLHDGPPARRDVASLERALVEIDRLGFAATQRLIWAAETACELRPMSTATLIERGLARGSDPLRTELSVQVESDQGAWSPHLSALPLLEQVEVIRTRPPRIWVEPSERRVPTPRPVHAREGVWRAHFAGYRGEPPGVAASVVCEAGRAMGYRVQATWHTAPIGPGRRSWSQVLFTRLAPDEESVVATGVPYGEADLIVGMDGVEALRSIGPDALLRVASTERTWAVLNAGALRDQVDEESMAALGRVVEVAREVCRPEGVIEGDFARHLRGTFLTDRLVDLALLGVAFQRGLVPVRLDAIEAALRRQEVRGYGRSAEAFEAGRRLGARTTIVERDARESVEPLPRLARRLVLELRRDGRGGRRAAERMKWIVDGQIERMPELGRTDEGRAAQRDLVIACHRAVMFGGIAHAQLFAETIARLHRADPDLEGKAWTRLAILPLAELWLPRDLLYVTTMSTSIEQHRRTREQLGIRQARGDRIERRYLNRIEATAFGRRFRLDFRSSDWPARLVRSLRGWIPLAARGSPDDRLRRDAFTGLLERIESEPQLAAAWTIVLRRIHARAVDGSLRRLTLEEFESLARRA